MSNYPKLVFENFLGSLPEDLSRYRPLAEQGLQRLFEDAARDLGDGRTFISTGDIPAMWLRDSSFQVKPLIHFAKDPDIYAFISSVIKLQAEYIRIDPYANAFNIEPNGNCWHKDFPDQSPWVFERKWEIDSLASFFDISLSLAEVSGNESHLTENWWKAAELVVETFSKETRHEPNSYRFLRDSEVKHDFLSNDGYGEEFESCGLIWSAFRPSDDACQLPFNIPQNAYAAVQLERLASLAEKRLASIALELATGIREGIKVHALVNGIYAYEVDGLGNQIFLDDANFPSLLSLPYLGFCVKTDENYLRTRNFALSSKNPYFFQGSQFSHIGSMHTGPDRVWPLAMCMEIITAVKPNQKLLENLVNTVAHGSFNESVHIDNPKVFTREWFSWADMTFVEALISEVQK
ncbi:MAG: glycoside hydrolase family 125 protein [Microbacteriaceae bacterium]|nr:glycoside hydrolase family 125 protein [Microbacteriaceae bacterium]NBS60866.1 glycoside hydrolase family 125 protein [Microbacteriaceae bacterium]